MKVRIKDIKVKNRIRRKAGNIAPLIDSMDRFGLMHPILVDQKNELVAGYRRLQAAKKLGWEMIDARLVEIENKKDRTLLEMDENLVRRDFSTLELDRAEKLLKRYEKEGFFARLIASILDFIDRVLYRLSLRKD